MTGMNPEGFIPVCYTKQVSDWLGPMHFLDHGQ
jgi:hypothetical protein